MTKAILIIYLALAPHGGQAVQSITHLSASDCPRIMAIYDDPSRRPEWVRNWSRTTDSIVRVACVKVETLKDSP
ncbi:MAG: hypothetical protein OXI95_04950 [bacterium]|nr:hypothetical protein [bacterium]